MTETKPAPICQCVERALHHYFEQLEGEPPAGLYDLVLSEVEKPLLKAVMRHAGSNQSRAARYLGINRNTLRKKLSLYGIE
ncbi:MAG: Fis family transcriptional regulator [Proteobacteria bacterium]|nr:MAG: Fis family transcriptional regulator [Pseudomonadota bacterium]